MVALATPLAVFFTILHFQLIHFRFESYKFERWMANSLILHLTDNFFVTETVERVFLVVVARVE